MPPLILASTSRYRAALLQRLGIPFETDAPGVDEDAVKARPGIAPQAVAEILADHKAEAVAARRPEAVVIGSDQLAQIDGQILGKPGTPDVACAQLASLAGRTHELITAVTIIHPGGIERFTEVARLRMRALPAAALARYVEADRPLDCAGAYKLESLGIALFEAIECADHTAIVGLPLLRTAAALAKLGYQVP